MSVIRATVRDGKIVGDAPADWPEGTALEVAPLGERFREIEEAVQGDSPEEIEAWIRWYDSLEPLILTPEDEARIAEERQLQREWFIAQNPERERKLREMFE